MFRHPLVAAAFVLGVSGLIAIAWLNWDLTRATAETRMRTQETLDRSAEELAFEINRHRAEVGILSRTVEARRIGSGWEGEEDTTAWLQKNFGLTTAETLALFRFDQGRNIELGLLGADVPVDILQSMLQTARQGRLGRGWYRSVADPTYAFASPIFNESKIVGALILAVDLGRIRDIWSLDQAQLSLVGQNGQTVFSNIAWVSAPANSSDMILKRNMPLFDWNLMVRKSLEPELWLVAQRTALVFFSALTLCTAVALVIFRRQRLLRALEREQQQAIELDRLVQQRTAELSAAQAELVQKERLALFGMTYPAISHEIAQPLTALKTYTENGLKFLEKDRPRDAANNFSAILNLTQRMNRIVANLRAFARGDTADTRAVDVRATIETVINELGQPALSKHVCLKDIVHIHADVGTEFLAEAGDVRAHQVILNLLQNAYRAVEDLENPQINVHLTLDEDRIVVDVIDNGPGIPPEMTEDIFESFVTTRNQTGLGLGLSISKAFVTLMGGTLNIISASRPEDGAHFRLTLKRWTA